MAIAKKLMPTPALTLEPTAKSQLASPEILAALADRGVALQGITPTNQQLGFSPLQLPQTPAFNPTPTPGVLPQQGGMPNMAGVGQGGLEALMQLLGGAPEGLFGGRPPQTQQPGMGMGNPLGMGGIGGGLGNGIMGSGGASQINPQMMDMRRLLMEQLFGGGMAG